MCFHFFWFCTDAKMYIRCITEGTNSSTDNSLPSFWASSAWGLEGWSPPAVLAPEQTEPNPRGPLGRITKSHDYLSTNKTPPCPNTLWSVEDTMFLFHFVFCTCQRPNFGKRLWSPSADWAKGPRAGQTACERLHLVFCAGQWGLPQERHSHAVVPGGEKLQNRNPLERSQSIQSIQLKISKLLWNNKTIRWMQLASWPEVVGAHSFNLRGMQTADQMAKCCQINSC